MTIQLMPTKIENSLTDTPPPALSVQKKRGFTLTEIAIVLGIIGLILGAIWTAAAAVYANQRVAHANTAVLQIVQAVRGLYATANTDAGLTVDNLVCAKAVPSDMVVGVCGTPATLIDPFPAGATTVFPTTDGLGFYITMSGVPQAACINLLMSIGGTNKDPGLFQATNAAAAPAAGATGVPLAVVATPALAAGAVAGSFGGCTLALTNGTVTFGFSLKS